MNDSPTKTVSLQSSDMNWALIDGRAEELGLDRSKYTQALYELDINYNLLTNQKALDKIKNPEKIDIRRIDVVMILMIFAIIMLIIVSTWWI